MRAPIASALLCAACGSPPPPPPEIRPCTQRGEPVLDWRAFRQVAELGAITNDPRTDLTVVLGMSWANKCELRIAFVDEAKNPYLQKLVMKAARTWQDAVGIRFVASKDPAADIRVSFAGSVNQAWIGTSAAAVPAGQGTVFLGALDPGGDPAVLAGIALHELGHSLGAAHEHQTPLANIEWNKDVVTAYYRDTLHWSPDMIEKNVYRQYAPSEVEQDAFDPTSIMMYPLPAAWTLHGRPVVGNNTALSSGDIELVRRLYRRCTP